MSVSTSCETQPSTHKTSAEMATITYILTKLTNVCHMTIIDAGGFPKESSYNHLIYT